MIYYAVMNWLSLVPAIVDRLPLEKLLVKPSSNKKQLEELQQILSGAEPQRADEEVEPMSQPQPTKLHLESKQSSDVSLEETVSYQNREIGKVLLRMEGHCAQKFRISRKACDCGQAKHLLDLESLCEETIPMVDNPDIYYRIIEVGRELEPKCVPEVVATGRYDDEFPRYSCRYRDLRKELLGNLQPERLFRLDKMEDIQQRAKDGVATSEQ